MLGIVTQATKMNIPDCWCFTCCFSSLEALAQLRNSELAQLVPLPFPRGKSAGYSDRLYYMSPFLDLGSMSILTISFLAQLASGILFL